MVNNQAKVTDTLPHRPAGERHRHRCAAALFFGTGLLRDDVAAVERDNVQDILCQLGGFEQPVEVGGQAEAGVDLERRVRPS